MPWSLTSSHHGIERLLDENGVELAQVECDPRSHEWVVSADPVRFPCAAGLPDEFAGQIELRLPSRGALLHFFGIPFPGEAAAESLSSARRAA